MKRTTRAECLGTCLASSLEAIMEDLSEERNSLARALLKELKRVWGTLCRKIRGKENRYAGFLVCYILVYKLIEDKYISRYVQIKFSFRTVTLLSLSLKITGSWNLKLLSLIL